MKDMSRIAQPPHEGVDLVFYGVSPWEIEVAHSYFNSKFTVRQKEIESDDDNYDSEFVSFLGVGIPVQFSEEFFKWFEFRRWEKVKALFKEMKRRRGSGNALKVDIVFYGRPSVRFMVDVQDKQKFSNAVEKMDFVLELLPYHLAPEKLPSGDIIEIAYGFDSDTTRWKIRSAKNPKSVWTYTKNGWKG